jgi:hypothetical protein
MAFNMAMEQAAYSYTGSAYEEEGTPCRFPFPGGGSRYESLCSLFNVLAFLNGQLTN